MAARKKSASKAKRKSSSRKMSSMRKAPKAAKRATAKRATKPAAAKKSGPISVGRKPYSKSQFISEISERTSLPRKEIVSVMDTISKIIDAHLQKSGPEVFNWPGMFKIQVVKKPATKARQGINPFTGESMMFKAKPASRRVKVRPLKQLKAMAA